MTVATAKDLLLEVDLPKEVWGRSGRPTRGNMVRWLGFAMFALLGLALPWIGVKVIMIAGAVASGLGLPWFADQRLAGIEAEVAAATKSNAASLLGGLDDRRLVALFAPHAWVALQKARLHLVAGDGRAAARALSECGRLCSEPKHPALLGGQARGFVMSGDRAEARKLLVELSGADAMSPRDHLDYGTILLGESGRAKQAKEEIERAAEAIGDHPQANAALAIVRVREDELDEASELLEAAEAVDGVEADVVAQDLIKKARKTLRPALKDAKKGKRSGQSADEGKGRKGRKKRDKRKERREKRKAGRARASGKHEAVRAESSADEAPEADAVDTAEADEAAADKAAADKAAADKAAADKAAADEAAADKAAADKAAADKAAADKAAADKAAADKAAAADQAADSKPAPPKPKSLFGKPGEGKPLFKAPPLPKTGAGSKLSFPKPAASKPAVPSLGSPKAGAITKPKAPAVPSIRPKPAPKVSAPKAVPKAVPNAVTKPAPPKVASSSDDDGWGDFLDDVEPPPTPKKD